MANYKPIGTSFDRTFRNDLNENFQTIDAVASDAQAKAVRAEADALTAATDASNAKTIAENAQTQLNNVIIESGTSNAEVIQARGGAPVLNERLNGVDEQLAENETQILNTKRKTDWVSVEDFGAKTEEEEPGFDSTAAFKAAIAFMTESQKRKLVCSQEGTYNISDTLDLSGIPYPIVQGQSMMKTFILMKTNGKELFRIYDGAFRDIWIKGLEGLASPSSIGVKISTAARDSRNNASMISFRHVVIENFYDQIYSDIEMDNFAMDGFVLRGFYNRGINFVQNPNITTAPTTSPVFKNFFIYSHRNFDAGVFISGAWNPEITNGILDGIVPMPATGSHLARGIVIVDDTNNGLARTRIPKIKNIHMEEFKKAVVVTHCDLNMDNVQIIHSEVCLERDKGNSTVAITQLNNCSFTSSSGGKAVNKVPTGGKSYLIATGCKFNGNMDLKTSDPNGFGERVKLIHSTVVNDTLGYVFDNQDGDAIVANGWVSKMKNIFDVTGVGGGYKISGDANNTYFDLDVFKGSDTTKKVQLRLQALGVTALRVDENGMYYDRSYHYNATTISSSMTIDVMSGNLYFIDASAGNITITIPYIGNTLNAIRLMFKRIDSSSNTVTLSRGSNKIDNANTDITLAANEKVNLVTRSNGNLYTI